MNPYLTAPMFPQPNGNVYLISNSLEVTNIPTSGGLAAILCMPENLLYIKTIQNGQPTLLAYTIAPYETPKTTSLESRLAAIEQRLSELQGEKNNV